jgi:hypothetical protein
MATRWTLHPLELPIRPLTTSPLQGPHHRGALLHSYQQARTVTIGHFLEQPCNKALSNERVCEARGGPNAEKKPRIPSGEDRSVVRPPSYPRRLAGLRADLRPWRPPARRLRAVVLRDLRLALPFKARRDGSLPRLMAFVTCPAVLTRLRPRKALAAASARAAMAPRVEPMVSAALMSSCSSFDRFVPVLTTQTPFCESKNNGRDDVDPADCSRGMHSGR